MNFNTVIKEDPEGAYKTMKEFTGDDSPTVQKQITYLPDTLMENEQVLVFCRGIMGPDAGLVVLTDKRTMFLFKGHTSEKLTSIPIMKINSLSVETGMKSTSGQIVINEGSSSITITKMEKKSSQLPGQEIPGISL